MDDYHKLADQIKLGDHLESTLASFFDFEVFPHPWTSKHGKRSGICCSMSAPMSAPLVPAKPEARSKVTQPRPDRLYGYSGINGIILSDLQLEKSSLFPATTGGMRFPFLAVELKAGIEGGGTGLWVAGNQVAGALATYIAAVDRLNRSVPQQAQRVDNIAYGIAADHNVVHLYTAWQVSNRCCVQLVYSFTLIGNLCGLHLFRGLVLNILDWGMGVHLTQIKEALDTIPDGYLIKVQPSLTEDVNKKRKEVENTPDEEVLESQPPIKIRAGGGCEGVM